MNPLARFLEVEICPHSHDRFVEKGWKQHEQYCLCDCSYCTERKMRKEHEK